MLATQEIREFHDQVDMLYGHYLDCVMGFRRIRDYMVEMQAQIRPRMPNVDLDASEFVIGHGGDPGQPTHIFQHKTTQGEFKRRNSSGGENHIRASQNLIVLLFAYWDSGYRERIAQAIGIKGHDLNVPVMGDLRLLRNDLIHCSGRLRSENAAKLQVLNTFKAADLIFLDEAGAFSLVRLVKESVADLPAQ